MMIDRNKIISGILLLEDILLKRLNLIQSKNGVNFDEWKIKMQDVVESGSSKDFIYHFTNTIFNIRYPGHERIINKGINDMMMEVLENERNKIGV